LTTLPPSSSLVDLNLKNAAYERFGVESHWVVDPDEPSIIVFEFDDGRYRERARGNGAAVIDLTTPFPVRLCPLDLRRSLDPQLVAQLSPASTGRIDPMRVTSVRIYPVKSMGGVAVECASVEPWGLAGDRRFGIVDPHGEKITARELHALLGFHAEPRDDGGISITGPAGDSIVVRPPVDGELVAVSHARQGKATLVADEIHGWLSDRLGRPVRLVWQGDPTLRSIAEDRGGLAGESLSLADAGPLLLASEASMAQLNRWIAADAELSDVAGIDPFDISDASAARPFEPLDIVRFRPNVVIDGDEPFAEDRWATLRIGEVEFRTTMICDRCVMTTIDPVTLAGGKEPIRTLARHRRWDRSTWFGVRLAPTSSGTIEVGDSLEVRT